jgi:hypothetical protein
MERKALEYERNEKREFFNRMRSFFDTQDTTIFPLDILLLLIYNLTG